MRKITSKHIATVAVAAVAVSGVGIAFAAWTSSGSGEATSTATTDVASTIVQQAAAVAGLYPGSTQTFTATINNPNDYPVKVVSLSDEASEAVGATDACVAGSVLYDAPPVSNVAIAPDATETYTYTVRMIGDAHNECKSQSFPVTLEASLTSVTTTATAGP